MEQTPDWLQKPFDPTAMDDVYVHESSYVDAPSEIGPGTNIMHFSHIMSNSVIGKNCQIGPSATVSSGVIIGNNVRVLNNAMLGSGIIIEDDVYCGPCTVFIPLKYVRSNAENVSRIQPTLVKRGASIGANTTIAAGFTIGQHTFVESGSVIDRNVPDYAIACGNTLNIVGWRCECGQMLQFGNKDETTCRRCETQYLQASEFQIIQVPRN